jgi:hypothetical protein
VKLKSKPNLKEEKHIAFPQKLNLKRASVPSKDSLLLKKLQRSQQAKSLPPQKVESLLSQKLMAKMLSSKK